MGFVQRKKGRFTRPQHSCGERDAAVDGWLFFDFQAPSKLSQLFQSRPSERSDPPPSRVVSSRPASYALFLREKCPRLSLTFTALMLPKTASGVPGDVALDFGRSGGAFGDMQNLVGAALRSSRGAPAGAGRLRFPPLPVTLTSIPRRRGRLPADSTLK